MGARQGGVSVNCEQNTIFPEHPAFKMFLFPSGVLDGITY